MMRQPVKPFNANLMGTLESLAHRGYTEGFLRRPCALLITRITTTANSVSDSQQFVGEVLERSANGMAKIAVKNKFLVGNSLELMTPQGNISFELAHMENKKGEQIESRSR